MLALDRSYHWTKRATVTTGIVGGGAMLTGAELLVLDVMFSVLTIFSHDGATDNSPDRMAQTAVFLMGAGAVVEAASAVGTIVTITQGVQLRDAEHRTGYRVSITPVVAPRANGYGALARVEF
jgi:hypothetical protein